MNPSIAKVLLATIFGGALHAVWMLNLVPFSRHAFPVAGVTVAVVAGVAVWIGVTRRRNSALRLWAACSSLAAVGMIAATVVYYLLELMDSPQAVANTFSKSGAFAIVFTALLAGGWIPGLLAGFAKARFLMQPTKVDA